MVLFKQQSSDEVNLKLEDKSSELLLIDDKKFISEMNASINNLLMSDNKSFLRHSDIMLDPSLLEHGVMVDELTELEVSIQS